MNNHQIRKIIGQQVRYYRNFHSLTQKELAGRIGADSTYITNIEQGKKGISLEKLVEICSIFNISTSDLLPIEMQPDTEAKEEIIEEILPLLSALGMSQLRMYKAMLDGVAH